MTRVYLLIYNNLLESSLIKEWANRSELVTTWRTDLPNCFYLVSEASARALSNELRARTGKQGRYLISEVSENRQGFLPPETWYLFKNKQLKPKKT